MGASAIAFIHGLTFGDLPKDVVEQGRLCLLDLLGVALAGRQTALSRIASDHAVDFFAAGRLRSRILFDGRVASPIGAGLAGAMTIDSCDGHDGHAETKGHVGVTVLPALLALAEHRPDMSGREFLTCLVLGYEIGTRAGIALHASACDYHTSGAWNALAAAALVGGGGGGGPPPPPPGGGGGGAPPPPPHCPVHPGRGVHPAPWLPPLTRDRSR
ncbi:MmgE/PrpD family protein [Paraburkholderia dipogonis]|uniref:MmgE/PrpD family protein n=1 Tax=Paraburkholderia dipogonis TaxID=1211383 RepID=UPI0038B813C6